MAQKPGGLTVQAVARQDQGRVRARQEDSCLAQPVAGWPVALLVVADGMGGHQGGDIASRAAVKAVAAELGPLLLHMQPLPTLRLPEVEEDAGGALPAPESSDSKRTVNLSQPTVHLSQATVHLPPEGGALEAAGMEAAGMEAADIEGALVQAAARAQDAVRAAAQAIGALDDAGATLTIGLIAGLTLFCAQVGDSRAYLWRHSQLRQLTSDHSGAAALVAAGMLSEEEARTHPVAHQLYRYLGGGAQAARPDITRHALAPGDVVLLCSDGLWGMLRDAELAGHLLGAAGLEDAAARLIDAANAAGGEDNITAVLAQLSEGEV